MRELPSTNAGKSHGDSFARLVVLVLPALRSLVLHAARARLLDSPWPVFFGTMSPCPTLTLWFSLHSQERDVRRFHVS